MPLPEGSGDVMRAQRAGEGSFCGAELQLLSP